MRIFKRTFSLSAVSHYMSVYENKKSLIQKSGIVAGILVCVLVITGCQSAVSMEPADDAKNPQCASVMLALPDDLDGLAKRQTDAQATGAWGNPSTIELTCGVRPPQPTTERCVSVNGIDWIIKDYKNHYRVTTYGRNPAVEITINDSKTISSTNVLSEISSAVQHIKPYTRCSSVEGKYNK